MEISRGMREMIGRGVWGYRVSSRREGGGGSVTSIPYLISGLGLRTADSLKA